MHKGTAEFVPIGERGRCLASVVIDEAKVIGSAPIVPVTFAHPFETIEPAVKGDRRGLNQVEVDSAKLADERSLFGVHRPAAQWEFPFFCRSRSGNWQQTYLLNVHNC